MTQYIIGTIDYLLEVRAALADAEMLPRRSRVVGGPDYLPRTYSPGAPGWTDNVCPRPLVADDGSGAMHIPADADRYLGIALSVGGKQVLVPPANARITDLPPRFDAALGKKPAVVIDPKLTRVRS